MPDDPQTRGPQDGNLINLNEDHDVYYWTRTLGVSAGRLGAAVAAVGNSAAAVREWLIEGD